MDTGTSNLRISRIAVSALFFTHGFSFASWATRIPDVQRHLNLSEGQLGVVLSGMAVGVLPGLMLSRGLVERFGSRRVAIFGTLLMLAGFPLLALAPSAVTLWFVLFALGITGSAHDVAKNTQAVSVERQYGRTIINSFHAMFSVSAFLGALAGGASIEAGIGMGVHLTVIAALFVIVTLVATPYLSNDSAEPQSGKKPPVFTLPQLILLPLGIVVFSSALVEGAMFDWATVYMNNIVLAGAGTAALGFAGFNIMMTVGRVFGDKASQLVGPDQLVRYGGLVAGSGLMIAALFPTMPTAILGFCMVGLGLSVTVPTAVSAAGNMPGISAGAGVAGVSMFGYSAFLAGPPLIGGVAEVTSLPVAIGLIGILAASLFVSGLSVRRPSVADSAILAPAK